MRFISALLMLALGLLVRPVFSQTTQQPITVCYQTDGQTASMAYVDQGSTSYYPIASFISVERTDTGVVTRQETWFAVRSFTTFVPVVAR